MGAPLIKVYNIMCGTDYHAKDTMYPFYNKMKQCLEMKDEKKDIKRKEKSVKLRCRTTYHFVTYEEKEKKPDLPCVMDYKEFKQIYHVHKKDPELPFTKRFEQYLEEHEIEYDPWIPLPPTRLKNNPPGSSVKRQAKKQRKLERQARKAAEKAAGIDPKQKYKDSSKNKNNQKKQDTGYNKNQGNKKPDNQKKQYKPQEQNMKTVASSKQSYNKEVPTKPVETKKQTSKIGSFFSRVMGVDPTITSPKSTR